MSSLIIAREERRVFSDYCGRGASREERRVFSDYCERSVVSSLIIVRGASCLL